MKAYDFFGLIYFALFVCVDAMKEMSHQKIETFPHMHCFKLYLSKILLSCMVSLFQLALSLLYVTVCSNYERLGLYVVTLICINLKLFSCLVSLF